MDKKLHPTLRLADGGSPLVRWANRMVGNNPTAMSQRGRVDPTEAPAPPPVAAPAPPPQTAAPVTAENPAGIRFADGGGLRGDPYRKGSMDGGRVVGEGGPVDD